MRRKRKEHWKRRLARQLRRWATRLSPPVKNAAVSQVPVEFPAIVPQETGTDWAEPDDTTLADEAESRVMTSMGGPPDRPEAQR